MLYSHNQENEKLNQFAIFLDHAAKGNEKYASAVNEVIQETHQYVAGQKDLYTVKRETMPIILLLSGLDKEYFKNLEDNPAHYDNDTYRKVLNMIQAH